MQPWGVLCLLAAARAASFSELLRDAEWSAFKLEHKKQYRAAEEEFRKKIFMESQLQVAQHNQLYERGLSSFRLGINQFSDMLHSEYLEAITEDKHSQRPRQSAARLLNFTRELPREVDWRERGAVTSVKNQNQGRLCKASWAFSAVGALEGQYFRKSSVLKSLSAQNLMDCSWGYNNSGCGGGSPANAFEYVLYNGGIDDDTVYTYRGKDCQCDYNSKDASAACMGFVMLPENDEQELQAAVATVGPVSVSFDASQASFRGYAGGIYYDQDCSNVIKGQLVNALVVGYGTHKTRGDYWLVKNSWGTTWGMKGYAMMRRNQDNHCGIASNAVYPLV